MSSKTSGLAHNTNSPDFVSLLFLVLVVVGCFWLYLPGVAEVEILDDKSSLRKLSQLGDSPELIADYVFGDASGELGRVLSMATFSIENAFMLGTLEEKKLHNVALHLINGLLVTWLSYLLFLWIDASRAAIAAVLVAAIWLVSPLQVSTVLYAVQRMAMLSTTFVLLSMVCYLKLRSSGGFARVYWLLLLLGAGAAAPFAKENGVLIAPLILVIELFWLRGRSLKGGHSEIFYRLSVGLAVIGFTLGCVYLLQRWGGFVSGYDHRSFTLYERVLTESRVLWDYIGQFYIPDVGRMGVFHDDLIVSTGLLFPASTLVSLVAWGLVGCASLPFCYRGQFTYLFFVPAFYLVAHSLESTVIPLELYFEHRNYLPSVALALLPLTVLVQLSKRWREAFAPAVLLLMIYVLFLTTRTGMLAQVWSSPTLLMIHHYSGHPGSVRVNSQVATWLAERGDFEGARNYSETSYELSITKKAAKRETEGDMRVRNIALACLANAPLPDDDLYKLAKANPERPLGDVNVMKVVNQLASSPRCPNFDWIGLSDKLAEIYLAETGSASASAPMFMIFSAFENAVMNYGRALRYSNVSLELRPGHPQTLLMKLHFSLLTESWDDYDAAYSALHRLSQSDTLNIQQKQILSLYIENPDER